METTWLKAANELAALQDEQRGRSARQEPPPPFDSLIEGETARFDARLWHAIPQEIKNRYPRARGNWFADRRTGETVFAVVMSVADGNRFIAEITAWLKAAKGER